MKSVAQCVPGFAKDPMNFIDYQRGLGGAKLGSMTIHSNVAKVEATSKTGKHATATFVKVAGEWRLLIGFQ